MGAGRTETISQRKVCGGGKKRWAEFGRAKADPVRERGSPSEN